MQCLSCRADMRMVRIEQDQGMKLAGYEHQTLECSGCQRTERRLAFTSDKASNQFWRTTLAIDAAVTGGAFYQFLCNDGFPARASTPNGSATTSSKISRNNGAVAEVPRTGQPDAQL
jgi:hypothetical protein